MTPLSAEMIALLTRHEVGTVERAMRAFMQLGLVVMQEDDTYYMPEIQQMTGKGSSEGERKARYRRQKAEGSTPLLTNTNMGIGQSWDNVPPVSQFYPQEIRDKSIENRDYIKESKGLEQSLREKDTHALMREEKRICFYGRYENVILTDRRWKRSKATYRQITNQ